MFSSKKHPKLEVIVGSDAKNNLTTLPGQCVEFVKQHMGDSSFVFEYHGKKYTAPKIAAFILKKLKADRKGWAFFEAQPFGYAGILIHAVGEAKGGAVDLVRS